MYKNFQKTNRRQRRFSKMQAIRNPALKVPDTFVLPALGRGRYVTGKSAGAYEDKLTL